MTNSDSNGSSGMLSFGEREPGIEYRPRPGAYAVIQDGAGNVAVLRTAVGLYLPGGGLDTGETHEAALRREVLEECGGEIGGLVKLGEAVELVHTAGEPHGISKQSVFFSAMFLNEPFTARCEPGEEVVWLPAADAANSLRHGSARRAIQLAFHHD